MKRCLVLGGAGFIGSKLSMALAERGCDVVVFDALLYQVHGATPSVVKDLSRAGIYFVQGDIRDASQLSEVLSRFGPDTVYHLAAETSTGQSYEQPNRFCDANVTGTACLVEAIRSAGPTIRRVVLAGSRAIYGEGAHVDAERCPATPVPRSHSSLMNGDFAVRDIDGRALHGVASGVATCPPAPISVYASTKLMQELLLEQGFWGHDVETVTLRLQNVFGPGQSSLNPYSGVLSVFAAQIADGQPPDVYEDGQITRDFVYVDDVVRAFLAAGLATLGEGPHIFDVGTGVATTLADAAAAHLRQAGLDPDGFVISGTFRAGDIRHAVADVTRTRDALNWAPKHSFEDGLALYVRWHAQCDAPLSVP